MRGEVHLFKRPIKERVVFILQVVLQVEVRLLEGCRRVEVRVRHAGQVGVAQLDESELTLELQVVVQVVRLLVVGRQELEVVDVFQR